MNRFFGCRLSPDKRDKKFPFGSVVSKVSNPLSKTKFYRTGPILNQGETNSCVGHAWAQFVASAPRMQKRIDPFLVYKESQKIDEFEGEEPEVGGTSVRAGAKVLSSMGVISGSYYWGFSALELWKFVLTRGTVVMGTLWKEAMTDLDKNFFARYDGDEQGGHSYLIHGVDADLKAFRCTNSWGEEYGDGGKFWISYSDMVKLLKDGGEACSALEI